MRGIEAALLVWSDVKDGKFASESIRRLGDSMSQGDLSLASSLVYISLRRKPLWKEIYGAFLKTSPSSLSHLTADVLCIGTAGLIELRKFAPRVLVNGLVQILKDRGDERGARLANAVLRRVAEEGEQKLRQLGQSGGLREQALIAGIPIWIATIWRNTFGDDFKALLKMARIRPYSSFRVMPEEKIDSVLENARDKGIRCWRSPDISFSVRLAHSIYPAHFPGYVEGWATPQSEASMFVVEVMKDLYRGGGILEMCSGRGVKTGQIANSFPDVTIECIELSPRRIAAAEREMKRIGVGTLPLFLKGDALDILPKSQPGMISLDVPCSGSGTWSRHPEGKWRLTSEKLDSISLLQKKLLKRAVSLLAPGGIVIYSTCSLLKSENENVVAEVLSKDDSLVELPLSVSSKHFRRGRPWGMYVWPELPWLDGFYMAAILKRSGGKGL